MGALDNYFYYMALVGVYPNLHPVLFRLLGLLAGKSETGLKYLQNFTNRQLQERKEKADIDTGRTDFLTRFLHLQKEAPEKMTDNDVFMSCNSNVGAGSDTTSITLTTIFYYLLHNPRVMDLLLREIEQRKEAGQLSYPVKFSESQDMPYLQAVLKESLRIHPAVGLTLPRVVPTGGAHIAGQYIPEGVGLRTERNCPVLITGLG